MRACVRASVCVCVCVCVWCVVCVCVCDLLDKHTKPPAECCYAVAGVLWEVCVPVPPEAAVCLHYY